MEKLRWKEVSSRQRFEWARYHPLGYECSGAGDIRFSALNARLRDGRTIEEAYQLDTKAYRIHGNHWRLGKGKPPINRSINLWKEYLALWRQWAQENPQLISELRDCAMSRVLTDRFANTDISQARALIDILNEGYVGGEPN